MIIDPNCHLSKYTTIRLGGFCEGYFPENEKEFISIIQSFEEKGTPFQIVGRMSNVLPPDGRANKKIIFCEKLNDISYQGHSITLSPGVRFSRIIWRLHKDNKLFYPSLIGVPGMVGGMVYQNASCFEDEISSSFLSANIYSLEDRRVYRLNAKEMAFSYRTSILKQRKLVLLNATFSLQDGCAEQTIKNAVKKRRMTMPEGPSLGSVFLRKDNISVGFLLDRLGQKGREFGGIAVSQKHAGVLINKKNGTASDFKKAVIALQALIKEHYDFVPECEVEFLS